MGHVYPHFSLQPKELKKIPSAWYWYLLGLLCITQCFSEGMAVLSFGWHPVTSMSPPNLTMINLKLQELNRKIIKEGEKSNVQNGHLQTELGMSTSSRQTAQTEGTEAETTLSGPKHDAHLTAHLTFSSQRLPRSTALYFSVTTGFTVLFICWFCGCYSIDSVSSWGSLCVYWMATQLSQFKHKFLQHQI